MSTATTTRRAEHAEATRGTLLNVARGLFASRGYAATSVDLIVRRARVTKGALYHHFADKRALFREVCEQIQREWVERMVEAASAEPDAWKRLEAGCQGFLEACLEPTTQRLLLIDGPSVLGWEELHEVDTRYGLGMLSTALGDAMDSGDIERQPVEPLAHLILGALNEAGLAIARAPDPDAARARMGAGLVRLLEGLRPRET